MKKSRPRQSRSPLKIFDTNWKRWSGNVEFLEMVSPRRRRRRRRWWRLFIWGNLIRQIDCGSWSLERNLCDFQRGILGGFDGAGDGVGVGVGVIRVELAKRMEEWNRGWMNLNPRRWPAIRDYGFIERELWRVVNGIIRVC